MRSHAQILLLGGVVLFAQAAHAQCGPSPAQNALSSAYPASPTSTAAPNKQEDQVVVLTLKLKTSGAVREVTVTSGPETLRAAAIKAAKRGNYEKLEHEWPFSNVIMLELKFPQGKNGPPQIRQAMPAGVPGCVYPTAIRVSSAIMQFHLHERVEPIYPPEIGGTTRKVVLQVHVDTDGNVYRAEKISGPDELASPSLEAVKKWKYEPYRLNGVPIEVATTVTFPDESLTNPACIPHLPCPLY